MLHELKEFRIIARKGEEVIEVENGFTDREEAEIMLDNYFEDYPVTNWKLRNTNLQNGYMDGKPYICHEEVTRAITRITDTHVICEIYG